MSLYPQLPYPNKYGVIYADCPWKYTNWRGKENGAAKAHYNCLTLQQLEGLPVGDIAMPDCALCLWCTAPKMNEGVKLVESWGFRYVTFLFTWVKTYKNGDPYCGLGFYTRSASEFCLLGIRGSMPVEDHSVRQVIVSQVEKHSQKPIIAAKRIRDLWPDVPRIELFARTRMPGWDCWGDEVHIGYTS